MLKIKEIIDKLWIDEEQFKKLYKEALWKELWEKTYVIWDNNYKKIKELNENKTWEKKILKVKKKWKKALKVWQLKKQWNNFLTWLWFEKEEKQIEKKEQIKKEIKENTNTNKKTIEKNKSHTIATKQDFEEYKKNKTIKSVQFKQKDTHSKTDQKNNFNRNKPNQKQFHQKNKKQTRTNNTYTNNNTNKNNKNIIKKEKTHTTSKTLVKKTEVILDWNITVKEFSEKIWIWLMDVMKVLLENKIMVWINSVLDFDTSCLIWEELWVEIKKKEKKLNIENFLSWNLQTILDLDKDSKNLKHRAPIVTIMWHVDHWKTTLLDYLRKSTIADQEAWWITQSIWASVVNYNWEKIVFIDTPWHELFTSLRARWAKLTNIVVIVIAADDWVMPQTIESINHAKAANIPIIIAITKIDKPWNKYEQIKTDIWKYWLIPEERGWDVPVLWISAKTWQGIDDLLENILLQAEVLELKYNPNRQAVWVVLDSYKDQQKWIITSIIIITWTLKIKDILVAHNTYWKIKKIWNRKWETIKEAEWWTPVQILWFHELPEAWHIIEVVNSEKEAQSKINIINNEDEENKNKWNFMEQLLTQIKNKDNTYLNLIIKSDWSSSLEALENAIENLTIPENIKLKIIHKDVWSFSDSDLSLANASNALLVSFSLKITSNIKKKAQSLWLEIKNFDIIYELTEYLENLTKWLVKIEEEVILWKLDILWIFFKKWKEMVIWWKVIEWRIINNVKFRIFRNNEEIWKWTIFSLQKNQQNTNEVTEWHECWMKIKTSEKVEEHDILEFFRIETHWLWD